MSENYYSLSTILKTLTKYKKNKDDSKRISKRTIYNQAPLGGISSSLIILFFISLPFLEFAAIFNPAIYGSFGIAQSIVFYIVFMSIIMIIIFGIVWNNNKTVLKKIHNSWDDHFPGVDIKLVLSSGVSPYNDFYKAYSKIVESELNEVELHEALTAAFDVMKEENKELLEAIRKDQNS